MAIHELIGHGIITEKLDPVHILDTRIAEFFAGSIGIVESRERHHCVISTEYPLEHLLLRQLFSAEGVPFQSSSERPLDSLASATTFLVDNEAYTDEDNLAATKIGASILEALKVTVYKKVAKVGEYIDAQKGAVIIAVQPEGDDLDTMEVGSNWNVARLRGVRLHETDTAIFARPVVERTIAGLAIIDRVIDPRAVLLTAPVKK